MTDKTIMSGGNVSDDYFKLYYNRSSTYKLEHFLTFDSNNYYIYKSTKHQKEVSYQEFLDFNYCSYIFFNKNKYNNIEINKWINFINENIFNTINFLNRPFPPIEMIQKIKIKK